MSVGTSQNPCENGGILAGPTCSCSNTNGIVGDTCEKLPRSCLELQSSGYSNGEYPITLDILGDGTRLVQCVCIIRDASVELELVRSSGNFNTNYSYAAYKTGYYLGPKDFFISLEDMICIMALASDVTVTIHYNSSTFQGRAWVSYPDMQFGSYGNTIYWFNQPIRPTASVVSDLQPAETSVSGLAPDPEIIDTFFGASFSTEATMTGISMRTAPLVLSGGGGTLQALHARR